MPVKQIETALDVCQAARTRIRNVFRIGVEVYLSFSSGKDSLVMAAMVYDLIRTGGTDPAQLKVTSIDEEGLYPSMMDAATATRSMWCTGTSTVSELER